MKIVQVGGGTAGWMTAFAISKLIPNVELTVIHNDKPIGVGEATFENIRHFHSFCGIDEKDYMKASDGTFKFSVYFEDFFDKGGSYHHPFQYGTTRFPYKTIEEWRYQFGQEPLKGYEWSKFMNPYVHYLEQNKLPVDVESNVWPGNWSFSGGYGYHMDAVLYQEMLQKVVANTKTRVIKDNVTDVRVGEYGIEYIRVGDDRILHADLFIDCSGFNRILLGELDPELVDFQDYLPNNSAVVARIPYFDEKIQMHPYTKATAMDAGWMWSIPLFSRMSHGYVYSDRFTNKEIAEDDLRTKLGWTDAVHHIKFNTGYNKKTFIKNVCAVGLSSLFIEPLESTGIAVYVRQIIDLVKILEKGFVRTIDKDFYNTINCDDAINIKNFIIHHFIHTNREDTEYWRTWKYDASLDQLGMNQYKWIKNGYQEKVPSSMSYFFAPFAFDQIMSAAGATVHQSPIALKLAKQQDFPDQMNHHPRLNESHLKRKDYEDFLKWKEEEDQKLKELVAEAPNHYDYVKSIHRETNG